MEKSQASEQKEQSATNLALPERERKNMESLLEIVEQKNKKIEELNDVIENLKKESSNITVIKFLSLIEIAKIDGRGARFNAKMRRRKGHQ